MSGWALLVALLCGVLLMSGIGVVRSKKLVHSVFWLASVLLATAALFVALDAAFLAGIQIVLYTGGVITMMLFGVMLTTRDTGTDIPNPITGRIPAALTASGMLAVFLWAIWGTPELNRPIIGSAGTASEVGAAFLGPHLLAFEVLSVLLLAAMVGAIVLTRKADA